MNVKKFASKLDGREYREEITDRECAIANKAGFLVIFGYSDDLVELSGVINDELNAYDGTEFVVTKGGIRLGWDAFIEDGPPESDAEQYFRDKSKPGLKIFAGWNEGDGPSWIITANHADTWPGQVATFTVQRDGSPWCQGLVVDLSAECEPVQAKPTPIPFGQRFVDDDEMSPATKRVLNSSHQSDNDVTRDRYNCDTCRDTHPVGIACPVIDPAAAAECIAELQRLLAASQEREADAIEIIVDIEQIRSGAANCVTIFGDDREAVPAGRADQRTFVVTCGDFTGYESQRWYSEDWVTALRDAAAASRSWIDRIKYTRDPDNCQQVIAFVGEVPPCPVCNGDGEYEDNGPKGCKPCNSRLIPFVDHNGKRKLADWGDSIERREDGLHLVPQRICHCGMPVDEHTEHDGHSPVAM